MIRTDEARPVKEMHNNMFCRMCLFWIPESKHHGLGICALNGKPRYFMSSCHQYIKRQEN